MSAPVQGEVNRKKPMDEELVKNLPLLVGIGGEIICSIEVHCSSSLCSAN